MVILVSCKNDEDPFKMKALECSQQFSHYKSMEIFQTFKGSYFCRPWSDLAEFQPIQALLAVLITCKNKEDPMKNGRARVLTRFSPVKPYRSYLLQWKPEF